MINLPVVDESLNTSSIPIPIVDISNAFFTRHQEIVGCIATDYFLSGDSCEFHRNLCALVNHYKSMHERLNRRVGILDKLPYCRIENSPFWDDQILTIGHRIIDCISMKYPDRANEIKTEYYRYVHTNQDISLEPSKLRTFVFGGVVYDVSEAFDCE